MSSLFKITTLCALSAALFTGCASTSPSNEVVRAVTVNAVNAQGVGQRLGPYYSVTAQPVWSFVPT